MASDAYPVLCGGTFFSLVLEAHKPRSGKKEQLYGNRDGLSEPETLAGLVRVMYPEFKEPNSDRTFKTNTSEYKLCKNNSGNIPFFDQEIRAFDHRVKTDYRTALIQMSRFVNSFIEVGGSVKRDEWLVRALLDLVESDQRISDDDVFYVCQNGGTMTKAAIRDVSNVCLPAFLLGLWHFVVVNRRDNTIGKETLDDWCPPDKGKRRIYIGHMGEGITRHITVTSLDEAAVDDSEIAANDESDSSVEHDEPFVENSTTDASATAKTQVVNNPIVFNQYGNNNTQIGSIGTLTIHND